MVISVLSNNVCIPASSIGEEDVEENHVTLPRNSVFRSTED